MTSGVFKRPVPCRSESEVSMYITIERASGGFRAHIYGGNHELMFWTEVYTSKASAQNAIDVVKNGAWNAPVYDRT